MAHSALITLYNTYPNLSPGSDGPDLKPKSALRRTLDLLTRIAKHFNNSVETTVDINALSPFVPYSLYLGIRAQRRLYRETHDDGIWSSLSAMETMLRTFSRRWCGAGMRSLFPEDFQRTNSCYVGKYLGMLNESPDSASTT